MKKDYAEKITFDQVKPEIRFVKSGTILPSSNNLKINFEAVNLTETKEQLGKIYEQLTTLCRHEPVEQVAKFVKDEESNLVVETKNPPVANQISQEVLHISEIENERKGFFAFLDRRS